VRPAGLGAEKAAIEKLLAEQLAGTNRGGEAGADGYVSIVTEDILWLPPNGPRVLGRKAVRDRVLQLTSARRWSARWKADRVDVAASLDLAHAVGTYELSYEDAGGAAIRDMGKFLETFRKQADGRWQETAIMFSSDLPVASGPER
jgi:ketosteroid isomerase-like protein